jgi:hypothetical protein
MILLRISKQLVPVTHCNAEQDSSAHARIMPCVYVSRASLFQDRNMFALTYCLARLRSD